MGTVKVRTLAADGKNGLGQAAEETMEVCRQKAVWYLLDCRKTEPHRCGRPERSAIIGVQPPSA